jgi:hypothetical protein
MRPQSGIVLSNFRAPASYSVILWRAFVRYGVKRGLWPSQVNENRRVIFQEVNGRLARKIPFRSGDICGAFLLFFISILGWSASFA